MMTHASPKQHAPIGAQGDGKQGVPAPWKNPSNTSAHASAVADTQEPSIMQHAPTGSQFVIAQFVAGPSHDPPALAHGIAWISMHVPSIRQQAPIGAHDTDPQSVPSPW
jgi:hypothetical protein